VKPSGHSRNRREQKQHHALSQGIPREPELHDSGICQLGFFLGHNHGHVSEQLFEIAIYPESNLAQPVLIVKRECFAAERTFPATLRHALQDWVVVQF
jgi:hypothetical protein